MMSNNNNSLKDENNYKSDNNYFISFKYINNQFNEQQQNLRLKEEEIIQKLKQDKQLNKFQNYLSINDKNLKKNKKTIKFTFPKNNSNQSLSNSDKKIKKTFKKIESKIVQKDFIKNNSIVENNDFILKLILNGKIIFPIFIN